MSKVPNADVNGVDFLGYRLGTDPMPDGSRTCWRTPIVAELGINHNGDESIAHKMIDVAADCGVDIVKFQKRDLGTLLQKRFLERPQDAPTGLANLLPVLRRCELDMAAYVRLGNHARQRGLKCLVTPFDEPSVDFLEDLGVDAYKVASSDCTNPLLLRKIAATGKPFVVSTGMTRELDVFAVVGLLNQIAPGRFALMHSVSGYPAAFSDCQLHMILRYKHAFKVPVGWSGHEKGVAVSVGAVAAGADLLERHFTLDRSASGPDHAASLEPDGLRKLVERVRAFEEAYGNPYMMGKGLTRGEMANQEALGKSLVARCALAAGEEVGWHAFEARSPGRGVSPMLLTQGIGFKISRDIQAGEALRAGDAVPDGLDMLGAAGRAAAPGSRTAEAA